MNITEFFADIYDKAILPALITAFSSILIYIVNKLKNIYEDYMNELSKENLAKQAVQYVEQVFPDLDCISKYTKAYAAYLSLTEERKYNVNPVEAKILIESAVKRMKGAR